MNDSIYEEWRDHFIEINSEHVGNIYWSNSITMHGSVHLSADHLLGLLHSAHILTPGRMYSDVIPYPTNQ
jgi:hypothetical protein